MMAILFDWIQKQSRDLCAWLTWMNGEQKQSTEMAMKP